VSGVNSLLTVSSSLILSAISFKVSVILPALAKIRKITTSIKTPSVFKNPFSLNKSQRPKVTTYTKKQKIIKGIISDGSETIKMPDKSSRVQNITLNLLIFDFIFGYSEIKIYF
tara:strand:+ start:642 stop:983 length:342 start_codon:yes stop_codon:yes gene_type:complete